MTRRSSTFEREGWDRCYEAQHAGIRLARQRNLAVFVAVLGWLLVIRLLLHIWSGW